MIKWEYKVAWLLEPCAEEPTLNKLGAERWELVAYDFDDDMGIFKRPANDGLTLQSVMGLLEWIHFREGGGPIPPFLEPDKWSHVQERLPLDAVVQLVKLKDKSGTALGAYHHNEGGWHIWTPETGQWGREPTAGIIEYWYSVEFSKGVNP